jgi:alkanesulfonate monooxygenase SsuD/methylene tetrahydromethanopterin reductase-like flavin-dependent oxidoreductase (luciferase family)
MGPVDHYVPFAIAAEEAGFDGITCGDSFMYPRHSGGKYPYTEDGDRSFIEKMPVYDPVVASALPAYPKPHIHHGFMRVPRNLYVRFD